jgi:hypothetical protein
MASYFQGGELVLQLESPDQIRHPESGQYQPKAVVGEQIHPNGDTLTSKSVDQDSGTGLWHSHVEVTSTNGAKRIYHGEHATEEAANKKVNDCLSRNME